MSEDIDKRTGEPYVGRAFNGHGEGCLCPPCIGATMSDLVEAGILSMRGVSATGAILLQLDSEGEGVNWRTIFKRYALIVSEQAGQSYLRPSDWPESEWQLIINVGLEGREESSKDE